MKRILRSIEFVLFALNALCFIGFGIENPDHVFEQDSIFQSPFMFTRETQASSDTQNWPINTGLCIWAFIFRQGDTIELQSQQNLSSDCDLVNNFVKLVCKTNNDACDMLEGD